MQAIETVCYTRELDEYFIKKRQDDTGFWKKYDLDPPAMYFGSQEGVFRIYPARQQFHSYCGSYDYNTDYDPRLRPWYIAASSGPKNVVLILDASEATKQGDNWARINSAATQVITTLTVGDRVSVIPFNNTVLPDWHGLHGFDMLVANSNNQELLLNYTEHIQRGGQTDKDQVQYAFTLAHNALFASSFDSTNNCNNVILFFTASEILDYDLGKFESQVAANSSDAKLSSKPLLLFTFSVGNSKNVTDFPKQLACSNGTYGDYSKLDDASNTVSPLKAYYQLMALGLADKSNKDFVAWAVLYIHFDGAGLGTTASAPVYDRSKSPARLLGVVGIDVPIDALQKALGVNNTEAGTTAVNDEIANLSNSQCPSLNLSSSNILDCFRNYTSPASICSPGACNVTLQKSTCHPGKISDLWHNELNADKSYQVGHPKLIFSLYFFSLFPAFRVLGRNECAAYWVKTKHRILVPSILASHFPAIQLLLFPTAPPHLLLFPTLPPRMVVGGAPAMQVCLFPTAPPHFPTTPPRMVVARAPAIQVFLFPTAPPSTVTKVATR